MGECGCEGQCDAIPSDDDFLLLRSVRVQKAVHLLQTVHERTLRLSHKVKRALTAVKNDDKGGARSAECLYWTDPC